MKKKKKKKSNLTCTGSSLTPSNMIPLYPLFLNGVPSNLKIQPTFTTELKSHMYTTQFHVFVLKLTSTL